MATQRRRSTDDYNEVDDMFAIMQRVASKLETIEDCSIQKSLQEQTRTPQTTFTLTQILTGLLALISVVGGLVGTYVSLTSQIATQEVSNKMSIEQIKKDINNNEDSFTKIELQIKSLEAMTREKFEKVDQQMSDLDSTVGNLMNRK